MSSRRQQQSFSSRGLTIEPILPYSKWRIAFNGLANVTKLSDPVNECIDDIEPQHINFTFL